MPFKIGQFVRATLSENRLNGMIPITLVTLIVSLAVSYFYTTRWNPEIRFWKAAVEGKLEWIDSLRESQDGPVTICYGGSATGFGIDAEYASRELDYPMANLGLHAGMGTEVLTGVALSKVNAGDTLLVMLEPMILADPEMDLALGIQFAYGIGSPEIIAWRDKDLVGMGFVRDLSSLRPGAQNIMGLIGKVATRRPLYRYQIEGMQEGGLLTTQVKSQLAGRKSSPQILADPVRQLLVELAAISRERKFQIAYAFPWVYAEPQFAEEVRRGRAMLLKDIEKIIPVVREESMGVHTEMADFQDSPQHLSKSTARIRTRVLVEALKKEAAAGS